MTILYEFPISHFCEKARWALAYKGIDYTSKTLLPGPHIKKMKALTGRSSVPVLQDNNTVIQGSADIISYLDEKYSDKPLTPQDAELKEQALKWEKEIDDEIGIHVRIVCYHSLLENPKTVIPFFTLNGPWYGGILMRMVFPKMREKMRRYMNINEESAAASKVHVLKMAEKVRQQLASQKFLVGDSFSRADLAAAALLAPLAKPAKYGLKWPEQYPEELETFREELAESVTWVNQVYAEYR